jgi:hypothetical protein
MGFDYAIVYVRTAFAHPRKKRILTRRKQPCQIHHTAGRAAYSAVPAAVYQTRCLQGRLPGSRTSNCSSAGDSLVTMPGRCRRNNTMGLVPYSHPHLELPQPCHRRAYAL